MFRNLVQFYRFLVINFLITFDLLNFEHKIQYFGNDSLVTSTYTEIFEIEDSLYITSITEKENQDTVLLRFRKEIK